MVPFNGAILWHVCTRLKGGQAAWGISGTVSLPVSPQHRRSRFSGSVLKLFSSGAPTLS